MVTGSNSMKKCLILLLILALFTGCSPKEPPAQIAATTLPVYEFTAALCEGTPLTVTRLVTEEVSCLHDYSLNVRQVKAAEAAEAIVISGAGLEAFLDGLLPEEKLIDASLGIELSYPEEPHHHDHHDGHKVGGDHTPVFQNVHRRGNEQQGHNGNGKPGRIRNGLRLQTAGHQDNQQQHQAVNGRRNRQGDQRRQGLAQQGKADNDQ